MNSKTQKKIAAALAAGAVTVGGAGVAFAFWSTSGSTTTTAGTTTDSGVTISDVSAPTGLYPGGPAQALDFTITNDADFDQYVGSVSITLDSIKNADETNATGCSAADFSLVQPDVEPGVLDADGGSAAYDSVSPSGASIAMNETGSNQDGCKDVTLNFTVTANPDPAV